MQQGGCAAAKVLHRLLTQHSHLGATCSEWCLLHTHPAASHTCLGRVSRCCVRGKSQDVGARSTAGSWGRGKLWGRAQALREDWGYRRHGTGNAVFWEPGVLFIATTQMPPQRAAPPCTHLTAGAEGLVGFPPHPWDLQRLRFAHPSPPPALPWAPAAIWLLPLSNKEQDPALPSPSSLHGPVVPWASMSTHSCPGAPEPCFGSMQHSGGKAGAGVGPQLVEATLEGLLLGREGSTGSQHPRTSTRTSVSPF